jgi:ATP-binding cassette subfamily B protein
VIIAKGVVLTLPFAYAGAVDAMSKDGDQALWVALALVIGTPRPLRHGAVRQRAQHHLRAVGQDAVRQLTEDVFAASIACRCASTSRAAPAR